VETDLRWTAKSNQRRLRVFLTTLVVALGVSLGYTWLRPPEYRASARLDITPGLGSLAAARAPGTGAAPDEPMRPFLTEVQVLVSRPILDEVATRLQSAGEDLSRLGPDPIAGLQSHLRASPVADTHVVELIATGERADLLAPLVNTTVDVYQGRLAQSYRSASDEAVLRSDDEVKKLEQTVAAKRRQVESFRLANNIVSLERDENEVLARVRNLSTSLSAADDRVAAAEGKLKGLGASAASGGGSARDDPTLASLEQRVSQLREQQRDLERGFTPEYLAKDPQVVAQRARLAELERQLAAQRAANRQTAFADAQEELASTQATAARIREQMASGRQQVAQFTARFNEYQSMQGELDELEKAQRDAVQRRARLEASEQTRMPSIRVLEAASVPEAPWRPFYWRDTAISVAGSLVLALLAMWLVELFNRAEPRPSVVLIQPQAGTLRYEGAQQSLLEAGSAASPLPRAKEPALLPRQARFPRELRQDEVAALVRAADDGPRLSILLLLSGLDVDELVGLREDDFDAAASVLHVTGGSARDIALAPALREALRHGRLQGRSAAPASTGGRPPTRDETDAQILCAAHDAGLEDPAEVTAACLRHTYLAFLVRQGIRFADLTRLVGPLPADVVGAYSALSPAGTRLSSAQTKLLHPALAEGNV